MALFDAQKVRRKRKYYRIPFIFAGLSILLVGIYYRVFRRKEIKTRFALISDLSTVVACTFFVLIVFTPQRAHAGVPTTEGVLYYHSDPIGSVKYMTDGNGTIQYYAAYTPYGEKIPAYTSAGDSPSPYGYTGQEEDSTGLIYYGSRYYDPSYCQILWMRMPSLRL